mmetsp:Transcript_1198/g.2699  ORF Transcript_1198/g.2699 Transcript_1198/m.2699 type:complete len:371 (-) Transcript_1198:1235-2347(-)
MRLCDPLISACSMYTLSLFTTESFELIKVRMRRFMVRRITGITCSVSKCATREITFIAAIRTSRLSSFSASRRQCMFSVKEMTWSRDGVRESNTRTRIASLSSPTPMISRRSRICNMTWNSSRAGSTASTLLSSTAAQATAAAMRTPGSQSSKYTTTARCTMPSSATDWSSSGTPVFTPPLSLCILGKNSDRVSRFSANMSSSSGFHSTPFTTIVSSCSCCCCCKRIRACSCCCSSLAALEPKIDPPEPHRLETDTDTDSLAEGATLLRPLTLASLSCALDLPLTSSMSTVYFCSLLEMCLRSCDWALSRIEGTFFMRILRQSTRLSVRPPRKVESTISSSTSLRTLTQLLTTLPRHCSASTQKGLPKPE